MFMFYLISNVVFRTSSQNVAEAVLSGKVRQWTGVPLLNENIALISDFLPSAPLFKILIALDLHSISLSFQLLRSFTMKGNTIMLFK